MKPSRRVLIIDDSEDDRTLVRRFLQMDPAFGNVVEETSSGEAGLAAYERRAPDVVLLDQHLPDFEGLDLLSALRSGGAAVPVILLTGSASDELAIEALDRGAQDYLRKDDITPSILSRAITNAIAKSRLLNALARSAERTRQLQEITAELSRALRPEDVASAVLTHGTRAVLASAAVMGLREGDALRIIGAVGYPEATIARFRRMPLDANAPLTEATRAGEALWFDDFSALVARYPNLVTGPPANGSGAYAVLPLVAGDGPLGAVLFKFAPPSRFFDEEKAFLRALAQQCAQAMERARLYEEARRMADFEQQLLAVVSHDLRNPLQAVTISAEILKRSPALGEREKKFAARIGAATLRAQRLIADLLDLTQARHGKLSIVPREADAFEIARHVIDEVQGAHPSRAIHLRTSGDGRGMWDTDRLAQVLTNLVANAAKYGASGAPIAVEVRGEDDAVCLEVHNLGPPIPDALLPHLFEPMRRGEDAPDLATRSIGLGLYIVKTIVDAHRGTVRVTSSAEAGTRFIVRLPRRMSAGEGTAA